MSAEARWGELEAAMRRLADVGGAINLLGWDQEVMMPPRGAEARARRLATLNVIRHELLCGERLGGLLDAVDGETLDASRRAMVANLRRDRDRASRLPDDYVHRLALARSRGFAAWREARARSDFSLLEPQLETLVGLKREEADRVGFEEDRYDALLDDFEPGMRVRRLAPLLDALEGELRALLAAIRDAATGTPEERLGPFAGTPYPDAAQWAFTMRLLADLGFDLQAGRQDRSAHPFTNSPALHDVRVTTRVYEREPLAAIFATIHEAGHGLYEQGLDERYEDTPVAEAASAGAHESQSRLWENVVGRSRPFWEHYTGPLREAFPEQLAGATVDDVYRGVNVVAPSPIRVEADEVTYNLHILIRFRLELALLHGELEVAGLPSAWNAAYRELLGLDPASDAEGVLQDVHWSAGLFGYFPTYALGNLYAAILWEALREARPGVSDELRAGSFAGVLGWLREHVHRPGRLADAETTIRNATGSGLRHEPLVDYLWGKFGPLYGVSR